MSEIKNMKIMAGDFMMIIVNTCFITNSLS